LPAHVPTGVFVMIVVISCCHVALVISQRNRQQRNTDHVSPRDFPRIFAALRSVRSVFRDDIKAFHDETRQRLSPRIRCDRRRQKNARLMVR
jgi:hypothetical protein